MYYLSKKDIHQFDMFYLNTINIINLVQYYPKFVLIQELYEL